MTIWTIYGLFAFKTLTFACTSSAIDLWGAWKGRGFMDMDNLKDLQTELLQVQTKMELDEQAGLGMSADDVHLAGELLNRIRKIRSESVGSN